CGREVGYTNYDYW
nr:immunoglobulin heavy chain junction region [Macaca mulatta]MOW90659.1 immunoglobulin heavy chain junction region [Macaca mulatta]MOW91744.1 immunoglobulin heavy chain junction region [Macaca mulatta]